MAISRDEIDRIVNNTQSSNGAQSTQAAPNTATKNAVKSLIESVDKKKVAATLQRNMHVDRSRDKDAEIIQEYESIPKYNVLERLVDADKRQAYAKKQELVDDYSAARERKAQELMADKGISRDTLETAYLDRYATTNEGLHNIGENLSYLWNRVTDRKGINAAKDAIESAGLTDAETELLKYYRDRLAKQDHVQDAVEFADEHEVLGTLNAGASDKLAGSVFSAVGNLGAYLTGSPIDSESYWNYIGNKVDAMRQAASDELGTVGKGLYDVGTAVGDMVPQLALALATGGAAVPTIMAGATSFGDSTRDAASRGLTPTQIMGTGVANAAIEMALEKIPVDNFLNIVSKSGKEASKSLVKEIARQMGSEAFEEAGTEALTTIADRIINGDKSNFVLKKKNYIEQGMTEADATKRAYIDTAKGVAYSGLIGGLAGGVTGGVASLRALDPLNALGVKESVTGQIAEIDMESASAETNTPNVDLPDGVHTAEQLKVMEDYGNASEQRIINFLNAARDESVKYVKPINVTTMNDSVADYILRETGIDTHGNNIILRRDVAKVHADEHIQRKDGKSPITVEDFSKIKWVIDNADEIAITRDVSNATRTKDGKPAPHIMLRKRIDGHYYVVEAVTDAKSKNNVILSAFIEEADKIRGDVANIFKEPYRVSNASGIPDPSTNGLTAHEFSSSTDSIPNSSQNVNAAVESELPDGVHTHEQLKVMEEYKNSSNANIGVWAERKRTGQKSWKYLPVATVNDTVADLVMQKYGLDIHGNSVGLNNSSLNHIDNEHINNNSKSTMTNEDLERIGYVLEHPDDVALTDDVTPATKTKDNQFAPKIVIRKRIDGHYYVVEAVTDAATGQDVVVTAFIEEVGKETPEYAEMFKGAYHVPSALENSSPLANVQDAHENSSFDSSIPNSSKNVNADGERGNQRVVPNGKTKISQTRTNTFENSGLFTAEEGAKYHAPENFSYESVGESESVSVAIENLNRGGEDYVNGLLAREGDLAGHEIDALMMEYSRISENAREGDDATMWDKASEILRKVQTESSKNAQALQALAKWSRNTPEGQLANALQELSKANKKALGKARVENAETMADKVYRAYTQYMNGSKNKATLDGKLQGLKIKKWESLSQELTTTNGSNRNAIIDMLAKHGEIDSKVAQAIKVDTKVQNEVLALMKQAYTAGIDSREAQILVGKAGKLLTQNITHTLPAKVKQFLYNQMLGNFRTLISRNAGGNMGVALMEQLRQPLAATIDRAVAKKTGNRTTTGWSKEKRRAYVNGFVKGFKEEMGDLGRTLKSYVVDRDSKGFHTSKSGENTLANAITNNDTANDGTGLMSKLLNFQNDLVRHGLSMGDRPFYEAKKAEAEVELRTLVNKQMNIDTQGMDLDVYIEAAARQIALEAVYQNDTALSNGLKQIRNGLADVSKGMIGVDVITQTAAPFVRTPGNVIDMHIEYSPFGVIKNLVNTAVEVRGKDFNQRRFVDETSRNILGTALFSACMWAFTQGLISGAYDNDKDMKNAQKQAGMQEYALHTGDTYMDLGWLPVIGGSVEAGAAAGSAYQKAQEEGKGRFQSGLSAGLAGLSQVPQSVFDQSMFTGLQDLMGNMYTSDDESFLKRAGSSIASGLIGQTAGSLPRQIAQSVDPYERELGKYGTAEYYANSFINSVPFLREALLPVKYDTTGQPVQSNQGRDVWQRILENLLLPGKITQEQSNAANDEAMRLYESSGLKTGFLRTSDWKYDTNGDGEKETLTPEQHAEHQRITGENSTMIASYLIESPSYRSLSDTDKASAIADAMEFAEKVAQDEVWGYDLDKNYKKPNAIYQDKGIEGVALYYALSKNLKDNSNNADKVSVVSASGLSDEEKGYYLHQLVSSSKLGEAIYSDGGGVAFYKWYQFSTANGIDGNSGKKKVSQALYSSGMSEADKQYFYAMFTNSRTQSTSNTSMTLERIAEIINSMNK